MTDADRCAELRDALTEVALEVADGTTRGAVMAHLATCDRCRAELSELSAAADELLLLVPEREPSADFEGRVLARLGPPQGELAQEGSAEEELARERSTQAGPARKGRAQEEPAQEGPAQDGPPQEAPPSEARRGRPAALRRHRVRRAVLAGVVGAGLLVAGAAVVWTATAPDRELAASYRTTLGIANGSYLAAMDLTTGTGTGGPAGAGRSVGTVFVYEGDPTWGYVVVRDAGAAARYDVVVTVQVDGGDDDAVDAGAYTGPGSNPGGDPAGDPATGSTEIALGSCVVSAGTCTAGGVLDVAAHDVVSVRLTAPDGETWATAVRQPPDP